MGDPHYDPHFGRPFDRPIAGASLPDEHPLVGVARLIDAARQVQQAMPDLPGGGGGLQLAAAPVAGVAAGAIRSGLATLVGLGRSAFAYPDAVNDILTQGRMDPRKTCIACSGCTQIMCDGAMTGCLVRDRAIYAEQYKLGRHKCH